MLDRQYIPEYRPVGKKMKVNYVMHERLGLKIDFMIAIKQDAQDPDFQSMLRTIGAVQHQQIPDPIKNMNSHVLFSAIIG